MLQDLQKKFLKTRQVFDSTSLHIHREKKRSINYSASQNNEANVLQSPIMLAN